MHDLDILRHLLASSVRSLAVHYYIYSRPRRFYAGQERGPEPQKALCIAQTSFLYGITPMWAVAVLVLLCNMIFVNRAAAPNSRVKMIAVRLCLL
jgi:hypothetical protein